jgi:hypothetical protein
LEKIPPVEFFWQEAPLSFEILEAFRTSNKKELFIKPLKKDDNRDDEKSIHKNFKRVWNIPQDLSRDRASDFIHFVLLKAKITINISLNK